MKKIILLSLAITSGYFAIAQTIKDVDGNIYNTVSIGTQTWLKEDLKVSKLNDGTSPNNSNAYGRSSNGYGSLYNAKWVETNKVCPIGWHIPNDDDWNTLINYLGGKSVAGGKLKESGVSHWSDPNKGADNSSGFTGLPGGYWEPVGDKLYEVGGSAYWWSSTINKYNLDPDSYGLIKLSFDTTKVEIVKSFGLSSYNFFSIRCIKDIGTGFNEINNLDKVKIYPNPAKASFTINNEGIAIVKIYSSNGALVQEIKVLGKERISVADLSAGLYVVQITTENGVVTSQRLLVE